MCPVCGSRATQLIRSPSRLADDLVDALADGRHLMHATPAAVWRCDACHSVFRYPGDLPTDIVARYADDEYGEPELTRLFRRGTVEYGCGRAWLRDHGLQSGTRVLEIGSYVGALMAYLRRSGCDVVGIDVGREVTEFARAKRLNVQTGVFDPDEFPARSFDAVVIVNCFEQLPEPSRTLAGVRRVLRVGGTLAIRTPNAAFAAEAHQPRYRRRAAARGILGVPFTRCFSASALDGLIRNHGFVPTRTSKGPWMDVVACTV